MFNCNLISQAGTTWRGNFFSNCWTWNKCKFVAAKRTSSVKSDVFRKDAVPVDLHPYDGIFLFTDSEIYLYSWVRFSILISVRDTIKSLHKILIADKLRLVKGRRILLAGHGFQSGRGQPDGHRKPVTKCFKKSTQKRMLNFTQIEFE